LQEMLNTKDATTGIALVTEEEKVPSGRGLLDSDDPEGGGSKVLRNIRVPPHQHTASKYRRL